MIRAFLLSGFLALAALAAGSGGAQAGIHSTARLVPEVSSVKADKPFRVALVIRPEEGWHIYWKNPGDSGLAPSLSWSLKDGAVASDPVFPAPEPIRIGPLMNYGYETETPYVVTITPPDDAAGLTLALSAEWLVCEQECVPEHQNFQLVLPAGPGAKDKKAEAIFRAADNAKPQPLPWIATALRDDYRFRLEIAMPEAERALVRGGTFMPESDSLIQYAAPVTIGRTGASLIVEGKASAAAAPRRARGVLRLETGAGIENFAVDLDVVSGPVRGNFEPIGKSALGGIWGILGLAFLGGLILNAMPCVFPVLSLKALHVMRHADTADRATVRREGRAYAAGVVLFFLVLAGGFLALREGGAAIGWGFQLQSPSVVAGLAALMLAVSLNLAGYYEFTGRAMGFGDHLTRQGGTIGSFFAGALAAIVATPCTGPFMAAALGAAMVMPAAAALTVFAVMGLGLAAPFLALSHIPALAKLLPKPGAWMEKLRHFLALPMFLTAVWLATVLWGQVGQTQFLVIAGGLAAVALGLVLLGRGLRQGLAIACLGGLAALAAPIFWAGPPAPDALAADSWSEAKVNELRAESRPVFVYFTADWCITCKVNERVALDDATVREAIAKTNTAVLVADWTRRDDRIAKALNAHGRAGVPLYLYYPAGGGEPKELPQLLTPSILTNALQPKDKGRRG